MDERAPPLNRRGGAKRRREICFGKKKLGFNGFAKKGRGICLRSTKKNFPVASEEGVSDDISFFISKKHDRPSSSVLLSNRHGRTIGEVRKEERWSLPQNLIYLFL